LIPAASVNKIAVLRANALGDLIFVLPALEAVRTAFPRAEIVLLGRAMHRELLGGRPGPVDRVLALPAIRGVSGPDHQETDERDRKRALETLRLERFDVAVQMHGGGTNSNPFVNQMGARLTAGLRAPGADPLDLWVPYVYYQHEVCRYLEVAALLGASATGLEPRLQVLEDDLHEAAPVLSQLDGPFVVLHPGASDVRRRWPPERFAEVGDRLAGAGASVVVTGTPTEAALAREVVVRMTRPAVDACGRLSLRGLVGLLSRCALAVANDTGPLHLAVAVGKPTVGIFWRGNMVNCAPLMRSRHRPLPAWQDSCPVCGRQASEPRCEHDVCFVTEVSVDQVAEAALELWHLAESRPHPGYE
jgi:ADP-heptose:LPS heptosyltransferase